MILEELNTLIEGLGIQVETGRFSNEIPDQYVVLTPLSDELLLFSDNFPEMELSEVRISVFVRGNYLDLVKRIRNVLITEDFYISDQRLMDLDDSSEYYHYVFDVQKEYILEGDLPWQQLD